MSAAQPGFRVGVLPCSAVATLSANGAGALPISAGAGAPGAAVAAVSGAGIAVTAGRARGQEASAVEAELARPNLERVEPAIREQLEAARAEYERRATAGAAPAERAATLGRLGQLYSAYNLRDAARDAFEAAARLDPTSFEWHYYAGYENEQVQRLDEAATWLGSALERDPQSVPALLRLGRVELERGRFDAARQRFEEALRLAPESAAAWEGIARVAYDRGDWQTAVTAYGEALERTPEASALRYPLALAWRELGDREKAREQLALRGEQPVPLDDPWIERLDSMATGAFPHLLDAMAANAGGDRIGAESAFRLALAASPDSVEALRGLVSLLLQRGAGVEALPLLRRLVELEGENASHWLNLGNLLAERGDVEGARRAFEQAIERDPAFSRAWQQLGRLLAGQRDPAALDALRSAVATASRSDPGGYVETRLDLARLLGAGGDFEAALPPLREAVAMAPDDVTARVLLAQAELGAGAIDAAVDSFEQALSLAPGEPQVAVVAAQGLLRADRVATAAKLLDGALERSPDQPALAAERARILAAAADPALRDGERAVALAMQAMRAEPTLERGEILAMAFAEAGDFEQAVEWQRQVIERAPAGSAVAERARTRLTLYENGEPLREPWHD